MSEISIKLKRLRFVRFIFAWFNFNFKSLISIFSPILNGISLKIILSFVILLPVILMS